jgi:hypothetical protein
MPRYLLIDEVHVSFWVPANLSPSDQRAIRRTLTGAGFRARLLQAARSAVRRFSSLSRIRLTCSR